MYKFPLSWRNSQSFPRVHESYAKYMHGSFAFCSLVSGGLSSLFLPLPSFAFPFPFWANAASTFLSSSTFFDVLGLSSFLTFVSCSGFFSFSFFVFSSFFFLSFASACAPPTFGSKPAEVRALSIDVVFKSIWDISMASHILLYNQRLVRL